MRRAASWGALLAAACSSSGAPATSDAGAGGSPICITCRDASGLSNLGLVTGILSGRCANTDGCHGQGAGTLGLSPGNVFAPLINVRSSEVPSLFRVAPGDPAQSYVYLKLACEGGIEGGCMPLDGPLTPSQVQAFHDWMEAGAPTQ
jgi:hypothetical protein